MASTKSSLVSYTKLSPHHSGQRTHAVDRITPHCVVGQCSVEGLGVQFTNNKVSSNYGIGKDGRVGLYVEENNRSWCSSSNANDQRAITIECASDTFHPYAFKDAVYNRLIDLCADICKRYGKKKLLWFADKNKTLAYEPAADEMVLTVHRWFANKSCPGDWLYSRLGDVAAKVTSRLGGKTTPVATEKTSTVEPYVVKITAKALNIRKAPNANSPVVGVLRGGAYTIVAESTGEGAAKWGKLKSGAGWISLDFTKKI